MKVAYGIDSGFINFPGEFSVTIYLPGCNLHCDYCYNKQVNNGKPKIKMDDILRYLKKLKGSFVKNDFYVVLSGGEPTVNENFDYISKRLYNEGYNLGIHTNGLILPKDPKLFKAVILSVKYPDDGVLADNKVYTSLLSKAVRFYQNCEYTEFRMVKIEEQIEWVNMMKKNLSVYQPNWKFKLVENFNPNNQ